MTCMLMPENLDLIPGFYEKPEYDPYVLPAVKHPELLTISSAPAARQWHLEDQRRYKLNISLTTASAPEAISSIVASSM